MSRRTDGGVARIYADVPTPAPGPLAADPPAASLRDSAVSGVKWSLPATIVRQGLRIAFFVVLARVIGPHDFGIASQAVLYIAITAILDPAGLGSAFVQRRVVGERDYGSICALALMVSAVFVGLTWAVAPWVASFLHTPPLTAMLQVLTIDVLVQAAYVGPAALLMRRLQFRELALADMGAAVAGAGVGIAAAGLGASYWSVVYAQLALDGVFLLVVCVTGALPNLRGSWRIVRDMWSFVSRVLGFQIVNYVSRNADNVTVQRVLGSTELGFYALAYRLMSIPIQQVSTVVTRVSFPIYSKVQDQRRRLGRQYLTSVRVIALISFPVLVLAIVGASMVIDFVFGERWAPAAVPLQLLAAGALVTAVNAASGSAFMAVGRADWLFRIGLVTAAASVTAFVIGAQWGIDGVAAGFLVVGIVSGPIVMYLVGRLVELRMRDYGRVLAPLAVASGLLAAAFVAVEHLAASWPLAARLVACTLAGAVAYVATVALLAPNDLRELLGMARSMLRRATPAPDQSNLSDE